MKFESDYPRLLKIASQKAKYWKIEIDASEILSELYVRNFSNPEYKYDFDQFGKEIYQYCANYSKENVEYVQLGEKRKNNDFFIAECTCTICKETKPSACFPIVTFKSGKKWQQVRCNDCLKTANYNNFKSYVSKNKKRWSDYLKTRNKLQRETLSDAYIRSILRNKYPIEFILKNPHLIKQTRERIINKRLKKKNQTSTQS